MAADSVTRPPVPETILRVGMTGHRPNKLLTAKHADLQHTLDLLLKAIGDIATEVARSDPDLLGDSVRLVLVSSLAEGADRLAAEAALGQGWQLQSPLPFERSEYRKDSADEASAAEFDRLIATSDVVFEINAKRSGTPVSRAGGWPYETAGLVMLQSSDLVIAVWDGQPAEGAGGTAVVVERAVKEEIPTIVIDPAQPNAPRLLWTGFDPLPAANPRLDRLAGGIPLDEPGLRRLIEALLAPPAASNVRDDLAAYLKPLPRAAQLAFAYPLLMSLLGLRKPKAAAAAPMADAPWDRYLAAAPEDTKLGAAIAASLRPAFEEADRRALRHAKAYRDAFVYNYLAAAFAVLIALGGLFVHSSDEKAALVLIELVVIASILLNTWLGQRKSVHKRWLDCRRLAERLRQMRFLVWSGASSGFSRPVARQAIAPTAAVDWVDWYCRAVRRTLPLPNAAASDDYLARYADMFTGEELATQIDYHRRNAEIMEGLDHRLHVLGDVCFAFSALACAAYLACFYFDVGGIASHYDARIAAIVTAITAFLPALGAAAKAIRAQGDFRTAAERSAATSAELGLILDDIEERKKTPGALSLELLSDRTDKASAAMLRDLSQWRILSETRPLSLPA
jgi:hypothetical protein